jgi:hypothetical protein
MKYLVLILGVLFLVSGCATESEALGAASSGGGGGSGGSSGSNSCTPSGGTVVVQPIATQYLIPCPENIGAYPALLYKNNNNVFAVSQSGNNIQYVHLSAGNYTSTDGRSCNYTVNTDGTVTSQ